LFFLFFFSFLSLSPTLFSYYMRGTSDIYTQSYSNFFGVVSPRAEPTSSRVIVDETTRSNQ
jgi:hypothetical protein